MSDFLPKALLNIQNLIKEKNVNRLKSEFIQDNSHPENLPINIDEEKGFLEFWNDHSEKFYKLKFEDYLDGILWNATQELISEINSSDINLNQLQKIKYWSLICSTFENIEKNNQPLFMQFPICKKPMDQVLNHLKNYFCYNPVSKFSDNSLFTFKDSKYKLAQFETVYDFLTTEYFIDAEIITFKEFFSVFNDEKTTNTIVFNCETPVIIEILEQIKIFFEDFTRKRIAESARFFTKPGTSKQRTPITVSIYNTNIKRGKKQEIVTNKKKIQQFFLQNFPQ
jgi:hypothetical protein